MDLHYLLTMQALSGAYPSIGLLKAYQWLSQMRLDGLMVFELALYVVEISRGRSVEEVSEVGRTT